MIGLEKGTVRLTPYSVEWPLLFEKEKEALIECLGDLIIDIQHVGSTAIEGLEAKPIIDILISIKKLDEGFKCIEPLKKLGYEFKGSLGKSNRFFFSKGDEKIKTHHVHIVEWGDSNWENLILFRDYLRNHPRVKEDYEKLKKDLANSYEADRAGYTTNKVDFILKIVEQAKKEVCFIE